MSVPKTTINEDYAVPGWEDDIGFARQILAVETIAISSFVKCLAQYQLRLGVF